MNCRLQVDEQIYIEDLSMKAVVILSSIFIMVLKAIDLFLMCH